jgi:hypothetical protein
MGRRLCFALGLLPAQNGLDTILQIHEQGQAELLPGITDQNADGAEQMTKNIFFFGDIFGFLVKLLDLWHPATFLGLLHAVAEKDHAIVDHQQRRIFDKNF